MRCTAGYCLKGEFIQQSRASLVGDHFCYSLNHNVGFMGDIAERNLILGPLRGLGVKQQLF